MTPNATKHNPSPEHIRALLDATNLTRREVARRIGQSERTIASWLDAGPHGRPCPYVAQYALEQLGGEG